MRAIKQNKYIFKIIINSESTQSQLFLNFNNWQNMALFKRKVV